jgi:hypothetical protein
MTYSGLQLNFNFHTSSKGTTPKSNTLIFSLLFNTVGTHFLQVPWTGLHRDKLNDDKQKNVISMAKSCLVLPSLTQTAFNINSNEYICYAFINKVTDRTKI